MDELNRSENRVIYCPLCGHKSKKKYIHEDEFGCGGEWICEACNMHVEAFYLPDDEEYDQLLGEKKARMEDYEQRNDRGIGCVVPLILLVAIVFFIVYIIFMS